MGKFIVKDVPSGVKFDLKAANGEVIATSQVYTTEEACLKGVESVKKNATGAKFEDQTHPIYEKHNNPKFEMFKDKSGEFRFHLKAKNGEVIAVSESYKARSGCRNGIESVRKNAPDAVVKRAE